MLAIAPADLFDHHAAGRAIDAPHPVQEENQDSPDRNELEAPLRKVIVTRRRLVASRADRRRTSPRPEVHFDGLLAGTEAGVMVNESPMAVAVV
jgi:hypothetical protein